MSGYTGAVVAGSAEVHQGSRACRGEQCPCRRRTDVPPGRSKCDRQCVTLMDSRSALIAGLTGGLFAGLMLLLGRSVVRAKIILNVVAVRCRVLASQKFYSKSEGNPVIDGVRGARGVKMEKVVLKAEKRDVIGKQVKAMRRAGKLPAVIYGRHTEPINVTLDSHHASLVLGKLTSSSLVTIDLDGNEYPALGPREATRLHQEPPAACGFPGCLADREVCVPVWL